MTYDYLAKQYEDEQYLVNMLSAEDIVRFGSQIGLRGSADVLDLCCGYGTMLKIWREAFGIRGLGIDRDSSFIEMGSNRLPDRAIRLICGDVLSYRDDTRYDVVVCTELSTGLFDSFRAGVRFMGQFLKPGGTLVFGKLFSETPAPPEELTDFDGPLPTLNEIAEEASQCGYLITSMASGNTASWERYIMRDSKLSFKKMKRDPGDAAHASWAEKWQRIYFTYRRPYEGWGLFGIESHSC